MAWQEAVNSGDNSHLVVVPAGTILSDSLYDTPLFQGEGQGNFGGAEAGNAAGGDVSSSVPCSVLVSVAPDWRESQHAS